MNALIEILQYRTLLRFLSQREWKELTHRTFLGFFWVLAYPFVLGGLVAVLFRHLIPSPDAPYPAMVLCGMIPWQMFSQTLSSGCSLLVKNHEILRKVRFPTETFFLAHVLARTAQFLIAIGVLLAFLHGWGYGFSWRMLQAIPWLVLQTLFTLGLLLLIAPASLLTKDLEHGLGLILLLWFYATPVIYPLSWAASMLGGNALTLYLCNPMVGIIEGYRQALLDSPAIPYANLVTAQVALTLLAGYFFYKKAEPYFAQNA